MMMDIEITGIRPKAMSSRTSQKSLKRYVYRNDNEKSNNNGTLIISTKGPRPRGRGARPKADVV